MDEPNGKLGWLEWAVFIAIVVFVVIGSLVVLGPQIVNIYQHGPDYL